MFDSAIFEVIQEDGLRYILRRNPERAVELKANRQSKLKKINNYVNQKNKYLSEHKKANPEIALKNVNTKISNLKLKAAITSSLEGRVITIEIDETELEQMGQLDGCYVLKTDASQEFMSAQTAHDRYGDLYNVEFAFRTMKTTLEEIRPLYLRKKERTKGHVFVAMLAYMIVKYISDELADLNYTRKFIFESLDKIQYATFQMGDKDINVLPKKLLHHNQEILDKLKIKLKMN
jgi:transposase